MKSIFISNEYNIVQGMKLAGLEAKHSNDVEVLRETFTKSIGNEEVGTIILTEDTETMLDDLVVSHREKGSLPLIVTIPGGSGLKDKNFIMKYVKESLGVKID